MKFANGIAWICLAGIPGLFTLILAWVVTTRMGASQPVTGVDFVILGVSALATYGCLKRGLRYVTAD